MYCKNCGSYVDDNARFCTNCGAEQDPKEAKESQSDSYNTVPPQYNTVPPEYNTTQENTGYAAPQYPQNNPGQAEPPVNMMQAVKLFFTHYADFSGRSRRSEFWWLWLFTVIVNMAFTMLGNVSDLFITLGGIWSLAILIPGLALSVRRLHDVGKSGVYYLWFLLPLVGQILLLIQFCKDSEGPNRYGPSPKYR